MGGGFGGGGPALNRGEVWWADLSPFRPREQTGHRPVVIWQSNELTRALQSVLVVPLTTNLDRANLAGTRAGDAGGRPTGRFGRSRVSDARSAKGGSRNARARPDESRACGVGTGD